MALELNIANNIQNTLRLNIFNDNMQPTKIINKNKFSDSFFIHNFNDIIRPKKIIGITKIAGIKPATVNNSINKFSGREFVS